MEYAVGKLTKFSFRWTYPWFYGVKDLVGILGFLKEFLTCSSTYREKLSNHEIFLWLSWIWSKPLIFPNLALGWSKTVFVSAEIRKISCHCNLTRKFCDYEMMGQNLFTFAPRVLIANDKLEDVSVTRKQQRNIHFCLLCYILTNSPL